MALPQGLNFRSQASWVADGANEFCMTDTVCCTYPTTTPQGNTVGYESPVSVQIRDRTTGNDRRLAGMHFHSSGLVQTVRVDLPSTGDYGIRLAVGDFSAGWTVKAELFDSTTSLGVLATGTTSTNTFIDAANTNLTAANWPGSNALVTKTFSSTICRIKYGTGTGISPIAHFYVEAASGGSASYTITPTGSISLSGSSLQIKNKIFQASGTITLSGTASLLLSAGSIEYTILPSGHITYSGTYKARIVKAISPSGNITYSGNAIRSTIHIQTSSGLITFSGSAPLYVPGSYIPTTSILLTGVGK